MRKLLMIAGVAAMAMSMPALAQGKGGDKGAHGQKADKGHGGGGHGGGGQGGGKPHKAEKADRGGWARQEFKAERTFRKHEAKVERKWAKSEAKVEKNLRKSEAKAEKQFAKQERRVRNDERGFRADERFSSGSLAVNSQGCPPGLAKKGNGCMSPGEAKKFLAVGQRLPLGYLSSYNIPQEYRGWYPDNDDYSYRYDEGNIYRVDNQNSLISGIIPLLGGAFGVGNILPSGFDAYNLPMQYRDDYQDSDEALYRYGDDAIYQVDPQTQMIEGVVALLAGDLNVGQMLPSGYDAYNLPMQYRDQYQDSDDSMYRYADGNIYEIDPKTQMIEQIVQMLG
jgi:hypothetical protein